MANASFCSVGKSAMATRIDAKSLVFMNCTAFCTGLLKITIISWILGHGSAPVPGIISYASCAKAIAKRRTQTRQVNWIGVWPFFRAAPNCGHNRVLRLCVSIGYSTTGKAGGYVRNATAARCPEKLPRPCIAAATRFPSLGAQCPLALRQLVCIAATEHLCVVHVKKIRMCPVPKFGNSRLNIRCKYLQINYLGKIYPIASRLLFVHGAVSSV